MTSDPIQTTDPRIASLPEWLRLQGRTTPEMDPAEAEWCAMMNAAAQEIERLRASEIARPDPEGAIALAIRSVCSDGNSNPHRVAADVVLSLDRHGYRIVAKV